MILVSGNEMAHSLMMYDSLKSKLQKLHEKDELFFDDIEGHTAMHTAQC